jgi:mannose-6-phosphate isomerase-like protein (cupin superfamily)
VWSSIGETLRDHHEGDAAAMILKFPIATVAEQSTDFRRVLWTGDNSQLVTMTIPPGGEIGEETHPQTDQLLAFVSGTGEAIVAGESEQIAAGDLVVVPAGTVHNFRNTGADPLVLWTMYAPPEHADGTVHATKEEAEAAEEAGDDEPPAS